MNNTDAKAISNFIIRVIYSVILIYCLSILYEGITKIPMTFKENIALGVSTTLLVSLIKEKE